METLVGIAVNSIFVGNILLAYFLGMCSFLALSKNMKTAAGLGVAVIFVLTITTPVNWVIYNHLLVPGAFSWAGIESLDLRYLKLVLFIATIAAIVQGLEMIIDRFSPALYTALGVFLPLITVNCAILGVSLFMVERNYTLAESIVFGAGSGIGWAMAIISMSAIQQKLRYADVPEGLKGFAINMITTGLMAMGFMLFAGISLE